MLRLTLVVLCAALVAQAAQADIAPNPVTKAQSLSPREATAVAMDAERVEVTLSENNAHVRAAFWLRNTSKSPTTLEVGFPDQDPPFDKYGVCISDLKVTVDGAEQAYETYEPGRERKSRDETGWYLWQMTFGPEQKQLVVVEYDCRTYRSWRGRVPEWTEAKARDLDMYEGRLPETEEFKKKRPRPGEAAPQRHQIISGLKAARDREFTYVLATGAGWHGPIGKGLIEVKLVDDAARCIESLNPHGASWQGDTITWTFSSLEPTEEHDIVIGYRQGTHHAIGLKPGIDNLLAALKQRSHEHWAEAVELAKRIGTKECLAAIGVQTTAVTE
jgi:hypothetical protein